MPLISAALTDVLSDPRMATLALAIGAVLAISALMAMTRLLRTQQRMRREIRGTVDALEELRGGGPPGEGAVASESPLALVHDAVARLGHDLATRTHSAEQVEEQYRALTEAVRDSAVVTTDTDGDVRSFSDGATLLLGWEPHEIRAKPASMLFEESSFSDFLPKLARKSIREQGVRTQAVMRRKEGTEFPAEVSVSLLRGAAGETAGFLLVMRDATERNVTEQRLRESERRYRSLVEGLREGVAIVRGGRITYANTAFGMMFDRPARQLEGRPLRERIATRDLLRAEEGLRRVESGHVKVDEWPCEFVGPDGARVLTRVHAAPIEHEGERAVLLLARDESIERRARDELRRNESQLDAVLESATDGILVLARIGEREVVQITNAALLRRLGLTDTPLLGLSREKLLRVLRASGPAAVEMARLIAIPSNREVRRQVEIGSKETSKVWLELGQAPLRGREGESFGRIVVCRDRTAQRRSERRLQVHAEKLQLSKVMLEQAYGRLEELNRDLSTQSDELRSLNEELHRLDEMKTNLLGNVSHELQTPLVSIRGYTEMILKQRLGPITDEQRRGLELCLKNTDRLISMIDGLLVISREDDKPEQLSEFPLRRLIDESVALLDEKRRERDVRVEVAVQGGEQRVRGDRDKIQQVFINLLSNAIKFNRVSGDVRVSVRGGETEHLEVIVEDTGLGIPRDELERIFERHYRGREAAGEGAEGSGIGLAIVREVLEAHGCSIRAESEPGTGTRFRFDLPRATAPTKPEFPASDEASPSEEAPPSDEAPPSAPRFRIIRPTD